MSIDEILEAVEGLTVLELNELVEKAEEKFGVSAAAPVAVEDNTEEPEEEEEEEEDAAESAAAGLGALFG